jgi:hypothetical protein
VIRTTIKLTLLLAAALMCRNASGAVSNAVWLGGAGVWSDTTKWSGGTVPHNTGGNNYVVFIDNGNAVASIVTQDVNGATINALNISAGDRLLIGNNIALWVDDGVSGGTITNAGTITLTPSFGVSHLRGGLRVVLTGGGTVTMAGNGQNFIFGLTATNLLINQNNTIQGAGQIGFNAMALANSGTIDANVAGGLLVLDPTDTMVVTNTATLQASNGGRLQLLGGTFYNSGTIRALDNSVVEFNVATVTGGTLTNAATGLLVATGVSTLSNVTQSGRFSVTNNVYVVLGGAITNRGVIALNSTFNEAWLRPVNNTRFLGGGTVELNQFPNDKIFGLAPGDLLINQDNTIRGAGRLGNDFMGLANAGTIDANIPGASLVVDPTDSLIVTNSGTMQASNGGRLQLVGGTFFNAGTIRALSDARVELSAATITGGTLTNAASGLLVATGVSTLSNVTQSGRFSVTNAVYVVLGGTITNRGVIALNSTFNDAWLRPVNNTRLGGGGAIELNQYPNDKIFGLASSDVLINQDNTIRGAGHLGNDFMGLANAGTIDANIAGSLLVVDPDNSLIVTNTAMMQASNGGRLRLFGGTFFSAGTIRALSNSVVELNAATITGGTVGSAPTGMLLVNGPSTLSNVTQAGYLAVTNAVILYLGGTITNSGTLSLNATFNETWLRPAGDTVLAGGGVVQLNTYPNDLVWGVTGTERLINQDNIIQGAGRLGGNALGLDNGGTILANQAGSQLLIDPADSLGLINRGTLQANAGSTLYVAGPGFSNFVAATSTLTGGTYRVSGIFKFDNASIVNNAAALILESATWSIVNHLNAPALANLTTNTGTFVLHNSAVFRCFTNFVNGNFGCTVPAILNIAGGNLYVTNAAHAAVLDVRSGTVTLSAGVLKCDRLVITNGCARLFRSGGTLDVADLHLAENLDADGDGLPNGWELQYGLDPFEPGGDNGPDADLDGDGFSNLQEFLAGTDPKDSASAFRITAITQEGNDLRITWMTGLGRTNRLESATDVAGGYAPIFTVTNTVGTVTNYLHSGAANFPARYYRVRVAP